MVMDKKEIIKNIALRTKGDIYLGVVGAVRTGKSTFIKKMVETLIVPNISDEYERKRCLDEIPQSAQGKMVMTTEPKFVPNNAAKVKIDDFDCNIKLIDCVGFMIPEAEGVMSDDGPRMVKSPWYDEMIPFSEAAEIGTEKVIREHATIGIVVTTDGSFGEFKREDYLDAEDKVIKELKEINKPFIVLLNTIHPSDSSTLELKKEISDKYNVVVLPVNIDKMNERDMLDILKEALYEFPIIEVKVKIPDWISVLTYNHPLKKLYIDKIRESVFEIDKLRDVDNITEIFNDVEEIKKAYLSDVDPATGEIIVTLDAPDEQLFI
jgi:stage IV sporulation protein A